MHEIFENNKTLEDQIVNRGKVAVLTFINDPEVIYSETDKLNHFTPIFASKLDGKDHPSPLSEVTLSTILVILYQFYINPNTSKVIQPLHSKLPNLNQ